MLAYHMDFIEKNDTLDDSQLQTPLANHVRRRSLSAVEHEHVREHGPPNLDPRMCGAIDVEGLDEGCGSRNTRT